MPLGPHTTTMKIMTIMRGPRRCSAPNQKPHQEDMSPSNYPNRPSTRTHGHPEGEDRMARDWNSATVGKCDYALFLSSRHTTSWSRCEKIRLLRPRNSIEVTLHKQVRYKSALQYEQLQSVTHGKEYDDRNSAVFRSRRNCIIYGAE